MFGLHCAKDTFEPANFPSPAGEPTVPAQAVFVQVLLPDLRGVPVASRHLNAPLTAKRKIVAFMMFGLHCTKDTFEPANFPSPEREPAVPAQAAFVEVLFSGLRGFLVTNKAVCISIQ